MVKGQALSCRRPRAMVDSRTSGVEQAPDFLDQMIKMEGL